MKIAAISCTIMLGGSLALAQDTSPVDEYKEKLEDRIDEYKEQLEIENLLGLAGDKLQEVLDDPDTYNKYLLKKFLGKTGAKDFLQTTNLKFSSLSSDDSDETTLGLGWNYLYSHDWAKENDETQDWLLDFRSRGTVAFDNDANPEDFISFDLNLMHSYRTGGLVTVNDSVGKASINWHKAMMGVDEDQVHLHPATKEYTEVIRRAMDHELYLESGLALGFETDQQFDNYQAAFGYKLFADYKAWNWDSLPAKYNLIDYPAALGRWISGVDDGFRPNGASIPTIMMGIDLVEPIESELAVRGGDESDYFRVKAEATYKSLFAEIFNERIFLELNARYFQELAPSATVKTLNMDTQLLYTIALTTQRGWYVSYSEGDLPFDSQNDNFYSVGFKCSF